MQSLVDHFRVWAVLLLKFESGTAESPSWCWCRALDCPWSFAVCIEKGKFRFRMAFNLKVLGETIFTFDNWSPDRLWLRWWMASGCLMVEFINASRVKSDDLASVWVAPVLVAMLLGGAIMFDCWFVEAAWTPFCLPLPGFCAAAALLVASLSSWNLEW